MEEQGLGGIHGKDNDDVTNFLLDVAAETPNFWEGQCIQEKDKRDMAEVVCSDMP